jgi:hypothetical protein
MLPAVVFGTASAPLLAFGREFQIVGSFLFNGFGLRFGIEDGFKFVSSLFPVEQVLAFVVI